MKIKLPLIKSVLSVLLVTMPALTLAGGAQNGKGASFGVIDCPGYSGEGVNEGLTCYSVQGTSQGNHELDCTIIVPDSVSNRKKAPMIAWANGWEQGNVLGQCTTTGYLRGLKEWASSGYVVAAANQWSVQESDVLACARWVSDNAAGKNALVLFDDRYALLVMQALAERGASCPKDMALAAFATQDRRQRDQPLLTGTHFSARTLGSTAMRQLLDRVRQPRRRGATTKIPFTFIDGETT